MRLSDLYNIWLKPEHLPANGVELTIASAAIEELTPRPNITEKALVLGFVEDSRRLVVNSGNANRLYALGGDEIAGLRGLVIRLRREAYTRQTDTIIIEEPVGSPSPVVQAGPANAGQPAAISGDAFTAFWKQVYDQGQTADRGKELLAQFGGNPAEAIKHI